MHDLGVFVRNSLAHIPLFPSLFLPNPPALPTVLIYFHVSEITIGYILTTEPQMGGNMHGPLLLETSHT